MAKIPFRPLNGLLLLDKAVDVSSNKALQDARFTYRAKKAGHTGTLDPFATGLLPVCFGEANKYARWLFDADKTYQFTAVLGSTSSTGDTEGTISVIDANPNVSEQQLRAAEQAFVGEIEQIPPKYSAIKVDGKRAYELARKGEAVEIPKRQVTIHALSLAVADGKLSGTVRVSKGTYIRTLVEDVAVYLGTVAYCQALRRTQIADLVSPTEQRNMVTVKALRDIDSEAERDRLLLPMDLLCRQFPIANITGAHWESLIRGRQADISGDNIDSEHNDNEQNGIVRLYLDGNFCGLGEINRQRLKAFRLLSTGF